LLHFDIEVTVAPESLELDYYPLFPPSSLRDEPPSDWGLPDRMLRESVLTVIAIVDKNIREAPIPSEFFVGFDSFITTS
jgi:hypothetical protein